MKEIKTRSAEEFRGDDGIYRFPFVCLDETPGGRSLGRIEWHVEPVKGRKTNGRYYIEKLFVWPSQTYDERYYKKPIFEIPCYAESITADSLRDRASYMHCVWRFMYCEVHKCPIFSAYPANEHNTLEINVGSSISIDIEFK